MYKSLFGIVLTVVVVLGTIYSPVTQAAPLTQDPRPSDGGGSGGGRDGKGDEGDGDSDRGPTESRCASLMGQVINWGVGGIGGITPQLNTGGWQVSTVSASDGNYGFGGLGVGPAMLHVSLAPEQAEQLQPLIQDAGVYLNCEFPIFANIALFNGPRIDPPATIEMSGPGELTPGSNIPIRLTIKNELPNEITNVVVTDLMPRELIALEVATASSDLENIQIIDGGDGQLVIAFLDKVAAGAEANIIITVTATEGILSNTQVRNTATLFYRESAADQDWLDFTISAGGPPRPAAVPEIVTPATVTPLADSFVAPTLEPTTAMTPSPTIAPIPSPTVEAEEGEDFVPPDGLPTTGDDFLPPPALLPVTGENTAQIPDRLPATGLGLILPLSGLGLAGLAFVFHRLRLSPRDRQEE